MRALLRVRTLLLALLISIVPASSFAGVAISITVAPPALPVYSQPVCPEPDYLWTPGYWAYAEDGGYYWVPGAWVAPPQPGLLWTPGYWGFADGIYAWRAGYWGPQVGFYGGVNYGFGYLGVGFVGGHWVGGHFAYNAAVLHVNAAFIHNTYVDHSVFHNAGAFSRAAFNGPGGVDARPTAGEMAAAREQHFGATAAQASHERAASADRANFASANHGSPAGTNRAESSNARAGAEHSANAGGHSESRSRGGESRNRGDQKDQR